MRLRAAMPVQSWKRPCKELIHEPTPWDRTLPLGRPCGIFHYSRFCEQIPISRLVAQDTTEFNMTHLEATEGLGYTSHKPPVVLSKPRVELDGVER